MYDSLKVERFRAFDAFEIPNLTRVNLLVGKNNAGKTSLLDAVDMVAMGGNLSSLWRSPLRRREVWPASSDMAAAGWDVDLSHLFHGHEVRDGASFQVTAGNGGMDRAVRGSIRPNQEDAGDLPFELVMTGPENPDGKFSVPVGENGFLFGSTANLTRAEAAKPSQVRTPNIRDVPAAAAAARKIREGRVWFLGTEGAELGALQAIWDLLVLEPEEEKVISAMRIIEPTIQRLAFIGLSIQSSS